MRPASRNREELQMPATSKRILLIDGAHCDRLRKVLDTAIDFAALLAFLSKSGTIAVAHYHRDLRDTEEAHRQSRFLEWLSRHGFEVVGDDYSGADDLPKERYGTNLVGLAVDALEVTNPGDEILLVAGDVKLVPLVAELVERGATVTLVSTLRGPPSISPHELLVSECSGLIDLHDHREAIARA